MNNAECKHENQKRSDNADGKPQEDNAESGVPVVRRKSKDDNASFGNADVRERQVAEVDDEFERIIRPFRPEDEDELDEAKRPSVTFAPVRPSTREVEEHMVTHMPFRSWCSHCVRGKAKGRHHRH